MKKVTQVKKAIKRFLKKILPVKIFVAVVSTYRLFFSYLPLKIQSYQIYRQFTERQFVTIKGTQLRIMIDPKNGLSDMGLYKFGNRDEAIINFMKSVLAEGDTFLDIGANIGYETLLGSQMVGKTGIVHSFEPVPHLVAQIKESLSENNIKNVIIHQAAVGNEEKKIILYIHSEGIGLTSAIDSKDATGTLETPVVTLDTALPDIHPACIKIDVEGYEFEVFLGAQKLLAKHMPPIVFEFTPRLYEQEYTGKSVKLLSFLADLGYTIYNVEKLDTVIKPEDFAPMVEHMLVDEIIHNLVAKKK
jgi:FkbM family methyltransferase